MRHAAGLFDPVGTVNTQMDVLGLPDGGYMISYVDNGWDAQDITSFQVTASGGYKSVVHSGALSDDEDFPASAVSLDGFVFMQHGTNGATFNQYGALIAPDGTLLTVNQALASSTSVEYWAARPA